MDSEEVHLLRKMVAVASEPLYTGMQGWEVAWGYS